MKTRTFLAVAMALAFVAGTVALPSLADAAQTLHGGGGHGGGYRVSGAYHGSGYHGGVYLGGYGGGGYGGSYYGGLRRRMRTHAGGSRALCPLRLLKPPPSLPGPRLCERVSAPSFIRSARWSRTTSSRPGAKLIRADKAKGKVQKAIDGLKDAVRDAV
jgi:hypothetical protein